MNSVTIQTNFLSYTKLKKKKNILKMYYYEILILRNVKFSLILEAFFSLGIE